MKNTIYLLFIAIILAGCSELFPVEDNNDESMVVFSDPKLEGFEVECVESVNVSHSEFRRDSMNEQCKIKTCLEQSDNAYYICENMSGMNFDCSRIANDEMERCSEDNILLFGKGCIESPHIAIINETKCVKEILVRNLK